jgi:ferredoxin-NADP reductase
MRITVKRVPGGTVSNWLHDQVAAGDPLQVRAPAGLFVPDEDARVPLHLIAAGIGVTPMVSIARYYQQVQPDRNVQVFYQVRNLEQAPLLKPLSRWAAENQQARLYLYVSSELAIRPPWITAIGRLDAEAILQRCERDETGRPLGQFMICGPSAMLDALRSSLLAAGVHAEQIVIETFVAARQTGGGNLAADTAGEPAPKVGGKGYEVSFAKSGCVGRSGELRPTLLEVAEEAGVPAESGCRNGDCGACVMKLLKGQVRYEHEPSFGPLADDEVLACVALPEGPITVDA